MGTPMSDVVDLFMSRIQDYRLNTIYQTYNVDVFNTYVEPWLLDSIVEFDGICNQSLTYTTTSGSVEGSFSSDLNLKNKIILSQIMVKSWLAKTIQDILQMNIKLTDRDFKHFAESQNLKAKQDYYNMKREEVSQMLVDYEYLNNNWSEWKAQNFDGSG